MTEPFITAGSLEVCGTLTGTFEGDGAEAFIDLLWPARPPRYEVRCEYPDDGADRRCPVCQEPASAVVVEAVRLQRTSGIGFGPVGGTRSSGTVTRQLVGFDPAAYRCEPCGHRFDKDGTEIAP